jgi:hypothetical protein
MTCEISILKNETGFDLLKSQPIPLVWYRCRKGKKSSRKSGSHLMTSSCTPTLAALQAKPLPRMAPVTLWRSCLQSLSCLCSPDNVVSISQWGCVNLGHTDILEDVGLSEWQWRDQDPLCWDPLSCFLPPQTPSSLLPIISSCYYWMWCPWRLGVCPGQDFWVSVEGREEAFEHRATPLLEHSTLFSQTLSLNLLCNSLHTLCLICHHPSLESCSVVGIWWTPGTDTHINILNLKNMIVSQERKWKWTGWDKALQSR